MTIVYFVRHAEPNYKNHDDQSRELSEKGLRDTKLVTEYLKDKDINIIMSSPYKRAIDTIKPFAESRGLSIQLLDDFRERKVGSVWIENFDAFCKRQWDDFSYKLTDGETLSEVQTRNIAALRNVLSKYKDKNIVIGSHGTALSTIINFYDHSFGYNDFMEIKSVMPWIVKFIFEGENLEAIKSFINPPHHFS